MICGSLHKDFEGESFVNQTSTSWETPYKFSGKEKDSETGYSYFGARYYDSDLSVWLSVDPMSDKYQSISSYMYVLGNPIKLNDPNGLEPYLLYNGNNSDIGVMSIYDDNGTPDDYTDDVFYASFDAKNAVTSTSNGKWQDGVYEMIDDDSPHTHGEDVDKNKIKLDSDNGSYGSEGIFRAESFQETGSNGKYRTGMGIHAGREDKDWETERKTLGCIRVKPEGFDKITDAIDKFGSLTNIIVVNNSSYSNSNQVKLILYDIPDVDPPLDLNEINDDINL